MSAAQDTAMLQLLGMAEFNHAPVWTQAKPPQASATVTGHRRFIGNDETTLINAYGTDAVEMIVKASDFTTTPEKFDEFNVKGDNYVVHEVKHQVGFAGIVLLYRCFCKRG